MSLWGLKTAIINHFVIFEIATSALQPYMYKMEFKIIPKFFFLLTLLWACVLWHSMCFISNLMLILKSSFLCQLYEAVHTFVNNHYYFMYSKLYFLIDTALV